MISVPSYICSSLLILQWSNSSTSWEHVGNTAMVLWNMSALVHECLNAPQQLTQSRPIICNSVLLIRHGSTFAWLSSWFYKLTGYSAYCCCCCVNIYSSVSMYTDLISHIPLWRTKQQICCWVNMENDQPNTPLHLRGVTGPMTQRHKSSRPSCLKLWSCVQRSVSLWIYIMS